MTFQSQTINRKSFKMDWKMVRKWILLYRYMVPALNYTL